jgi:hypothetical protein
MSTNSFNIRPEILELLQERAGNALKLIGMDNNFLNKTQMTQTRLTNGTS